MFEVNEDGSFSVAGETAIGPLLPPNAISATMASPGGSTPPGDAVKGRSPRPLDDGDVGF